MKPQITAEPKSAAAIQIRVDDQCLPCSMAEELPSQGWRSLGSSSGLVLIGVSVKARILLGVEGVITTLKFKQLGVAALLHQGSLIHHQNHV